MVTNRRKITVNATEAMEIHQEALVIDSQQPCVTSGNQIFTENMRDALDNYVKKGLSRGQISEILVDMAVQEIKQSESVRREYMNQWKMAGVDVASSTYAATDPPDTAYDSGIKSISQGRAIIDSLDGELILVLNARDIERVYSEGRRGVIFNFQNATPFGSDLDRIETFHNLGLRVVQLTYNLRNLLGDGCTERYQTGLTYFGREVVETLNSKQMAVDISHCSERVGWDAIEISKAPVIVTHSSSRSVCYHDRGKGDDLAKAVADSGGFFGVAALGAFLYDGSSVTLDHFVDHVEHLVNIIGIDHVGIGSDKCGPGPCTESMFEFPESHGPFGQSFLYKDDLDSKFTPRGFNWSGWRPEHRWMDEHRVDGFDKFVDWPNITVKLAERGFGEEELRKILGLNYLRFFQEVIG